MISMKIIPDIVAAIYLLVGLITILFDMPKSYKGDKDGIDWNWIVSMAIIVAAHTWLCLLVIADIWTCMK